MPGVEAGEESRRRYKDRSYGLMIHTGRLSRTLGLKPGVAVVIGECHHTRGAGELRLEQAARMTPAEMIAQANRIQRIDGFNRTGYIGPACGGRRRTIVKLNPELVEVRREKRDSPLVHRAMFERCDIRVPIDADGRLAG